MSPIVPVRVVLSEVEPEDSCWVDVEYYHDNEGGDSAQTVIAIHSSSDMLEVLDADERTVRVRFNGEFESRSFLRGLQLILNAHELVDKVNGVKHG